MPSISIEQQGRMTVAPRLQPGIHCAWRVPVELARISQLVSD
ncbi:MAG: hypothetical protein U9R25_02960 [Chloroflexota bacterium]|nr:hypothetical protein [Chloroflexota bacterium]